MGPFGGYPHFIDKESGTKRGCDLLEVTQLTIGGVRARTNVFWLPAPHPAEVSLMKVFKNKTLRQLLARCPP